MLTREHDTQVESDENSRLQSYKRNKEQRYQHSCIICNKTFKKKSHLTRHLKGHSGERPFRCDKCEKSYARREHLSRHEIVHNGNWSFFCEYRNCGKSFIDRAHLKRHEFVHSKPFTCDRCTSSFGNFEQLFKHKLRHQFDANSESGKPYKCTYKDCGEGYTSISGLKKHLRLHEGTNGYCCEACGASFTKFKHLSLHRKEEHPFSHKCNECGKEFKNSKNLLDHCRLLHSEECRNGDTSFICPVDDCGMSFGSKRSIKVHTRAKHLRSIHFECKLCDISFGTESFFLLHMQKHHGEYASQVKLREFMVACVADGTSICHAKKMGENASIEKEMKRDVVITEEVCTSIVQPVEEQQDCLVESEEDMNEANKGLRSHITHTSSTCCDLSIDKFEGKEEGDEVLKEGPPFKRIFVDAIAL